MSTDTTEATADGPSWVERHPGLSLALLLLGLLALLDVVAGVGFRLAAGYPYFIRPQRIGWAHYLEREQLYRVSNALYDHDLAPLKSVDGVTWGPLVYGVRTNSLGFKDATNRTVSLEAPGPRVLFIGDSFTEGVGFAYEDTFVGLVDSAFAGRGIDVLNAAVVSYSPSIYARKVEYLLDEVGLDVDEVVVFLDISDAQDEAQVYRRLEDGRVVTRDQFGGFASQPPVAARDPGAVGTLKALLRENTIVLATILQLKDRLGAGVVDDNFPLNNERSLWTVDSTAYADYGREGVALMERAMSRLNDTLRRHDVALTVAVYPWPDQVAASDLDSRQVRVWRDWSAAHDAHFVNLFPAFIDANPDTEPIETLRRYYVPGDYHWNAAGHRLVASAFLSQYSPPDNGAAAGAGAP